MTAYGFLAGLRDHPLHRIVRRPRRRTSRGCRRGGVTGRVEQLPQPGSSFTVVDSRGKEHSVSLRPRTRVRLPLVGGLPRLRRGLRVRARGRLCPTGRLDARSVIEVG
jgi:hypothetical protein